MDKKKLNKNDLKYKLKIFTNRTWKKVLIVITSLILLNTIVYFITGKNLIERSVKILLYKAGIYTEEVKNIDINSSNWFNNEQGSWNIDKSAEWIGLNKAQLTLDLTTIIKTNDKSKDVILVLDISESMEGEKLDKVKNDTIELSQYLLSGYDNKVALITFDTISEIITDFTDDSELIINSVNNLNTRGATNYNIALKNVETILNNYQYSEDRELVVLFLTDGYPNEETPNQVSQYKYLKERYPYILIKGIQYEMGKDIIKEIIEISDYQFLASTDNLNNVLFEASLSPESYESFEITDYIDNEYFFIENPNDIKVDIGKYLLEEENGYQKVIWNLGNNSLPTGKNVKMKIYLTIKEKYQFNNGLYPTNTKETIKSKLKDSDEEIVNSTKTPVLKNGYKIIYDTNEPKDCRVKSIDEEEHFAFETINKRKDELLCPGYIFKGWEVEEDVNKINDDTFIMPPKNITIRGIWTSHNISKSMEGTIHEKATLWKKVKNDAEKGLYGAKILSSTINDTYKVYYYNQPTRNNVYFANSCWKIIRTTDTGGVKILYNGKPTSGISCENPSFSSIPQSAFNNSIESIANVGYMYNETPITNKVSITTSFFQLTSQVAGVNYRYFSDSYRKENGRYYLENKDGSNPIERDWSTDYASLTGYYTCINQSSCTELSYISGASKVYAYVLTINNNQDIDDVNSSLKIGKNYIKNANGTYTLTDVSNLKISDWYSNYKNYNKQYICSDYSTITCSDLKIIIAEQNEIGITYENALNNEEEGYLYGNSFTFDGTSYHLVDTISFDTWTNTFDNIDRNHYSCFNTTGICNTIYFLTNATAVDKYYYELTNGRGIEDFLNEVLHNEETNKYNSIAKNTLEEWYENNLLGYTNSIEDTVYCNNRQIADLKNLSPTGDLNNVWAAITFTDNDNPSLTCPNINDRFTVSKDNGNGKSKYPIGLLTKKEVQLVGSGVLGSSMAHWLMTPSRYLISYRSASIAYGKGGTVYYNSPTSNQYVIPLISLKNNVGYVSGNGTPSNPYVIE